VCVFREHDAEVRCLAFTPDGSILASGGEDRVIRIWSGLKTVEPQGASVQPRKWADDAEMQNAALAISPDGKRLASPGGGTTLRIWDVESGQLLSGLQERGGTGAQTSASGIRAAAWSPNGRYLAAGGEGNLLHLWELQSNKLLKPEGHAGVVTSLAFSPDSKLLASAAGQRGDVWLWDVATGEPWLLIPEAVDACSVEALAFHPARRLLAAAGVDWLATGGSDGAVAVWDVDQRREVVLLDGGGVSVAFHPRSNRLAVAGLGQSIRIWDYETATMVAELAGHEEAVTVVAYSPDGRWLASAGNDRTVRLWDANTGAASGGIELDTQALALAFAPDSSSLFTANANTSCYRLEVARLVQG
jgi:WD40 repeat protein